VTVNAALGSREAPARSPGRAAEPVMLPATSGFEAVSAGIDQKFQLSVRLHRPAGK
jgi:hypothetical protein